MATRSIWITILVFTMLASKAASANPSIVRNFLTHMAQTIQEQKQVKENLLAFQSTQAGLAAAHRGWFPTLSLRFDSHYFEKTSGKGGESFEIIPGISLPSSLLSSTNTSYFQTNLGITLKQPLWDNGEIRGDLALNTQQVRSAREALQSAEREVIQAGTAELLALWRGLLSLARLKEEQTLQQAKGRWLARHIAKGWGSLSEQREHRLKTQALEAEIAEVETEIISHQAYLTERFAFSFEQLEEVPELARDPLLMKALSFQSLLGHARTRDPKLIALSGEIEQMAVQKIQLGSRTNPRAFYYTTLDWLQSDAAWKNTFHHLDRVVKAGCQLEWSFFDSGRTSLTLLELEGKIASLETAKEKQLEESKEQLRALFNQFHEQQRTLRRLDEVTHFEASRVNRFKKFTKKGWMTALDVTEAVFLLSEQQRKKQETLLDILQTKMTLAQLTGQSIGEL